MVGIMGKLIIQVSNLPFLVFAGECWEFLLVFSTNRKVNLLFLQNLRSQFI